MLPLQVLVIGRDTTTIAALENYLAGAGVAARTARSMRDAATVEPSTAAVVLFPDEFAARDVLAAVAAVRGACPAVLIVLITSAPQSFRSATMSDGSSTPPLVMPRPAFGWALLDAIREHAESRRAGPAPFVQETL